MRKRVKRLRQNYYSKRELKKKLWVFCFRYTYKNTYIRIIVRMKNRVYTYKYTYNIDSTFLFDYINSNYETLRFTY